jgi:diguanylate cyclase (GGDEF)-like protein
MPLMIDKDAMNAFFSSQLDFILFFYGLAFILLGSICFGIARGGQKGTPWLVLGSFAFVHGTSEWLDLFALITADSPVFAICRTGVMTLSFMILVEFARLEGARLGLKVPGRWIYAPLLLMVAWGAYLSGLNGANALARYAIGLPGALATAAVLALHAKDASAAERRWIFGAVTCLVLYGIAAGFIVPPTANWEGDIFNYDDFSNLTGMPIQFLRGLLACGIAFSIWGFWGQRLARNVASTRYTKFMHQQFAWTLITMSAILVLGWVLTEYLGGIYKENIQAEARGDLDLISDRLIGETRTSDGIVRLLAGSREIDGLLIDGDKRYEPRVKSLLMLNSEVAGASGVYVLDRKAKVIASYSNDSENTAPAVFYPGTSYFKSSMSGEAGHRFEVSEHGKSRDYLTSYPVRDEAGDVAGDVVVKKSLDKIAADLQRFDVSFYLIDVHGVVVATNRPESQYQTLWPLAPGIAASLTLQYGPLNAVPLLKQEVVGASWTVFRGARAFVQRRPVANSDWSLVTAMAPSGIFASRVLGIIITLQMTTLALVYLVGHERWVHDNVQLQKRIELEELARHLDYHAATDPLTGLYNRRKFDRELSIEMRRSQRYHTPLALTLFDVDHFKVINDTHGHQVGDNVLVELARFVSSRLRSTDVFARWGGEEFVILTPAVDAGRACQLATKLGAAIRGHTMNVDHPITCSFGVTQFEPSDTAESLIARVDEALYRAKINGRDRVELAEPPAIEGPNLVPAV